MTSRADLAGMSMALGGMQAALQPRERTWRQAFYDNAIGWMFQYCNGTCCRNYHQHNKDELTEAQINEIAANNTRRIQICAHQRLGLANKFAFWGGAAVGATGTAIAVGVLGLSLITLLPVVGAAVVGYLAYRTFRYFLSKQAKADLSSAVSEGRREARQGKEIVGPQKPKNRPGPRIASRCVSHD